MMSDISGARKFAVKAKELGTAVDENYAKAIGID